MSDSKSALRAVVRGRVQGVGFRDAVVSRAHEVGALGWVRNAEDGTLLAHVEGPEPAVEPVVAFLGEGPPAARVEAVEVEGTKVEGHEQFAVRGVSAGAFVVQEHQGTRHHFDLRLEVDGAMRTWAVPKGPSMDPAVKRMAIEVESAEEDGVVWDRGTYEQGGRVPWSEALERGHAVFVLHGDRLAGGFALQRTRAGGNSQWLLIKRKDEFARSSN
jgi:acylphosphatase